MSPHGEPAHLLRPSSAASQELPASVTQLQTSCPWLRNRFKGVPPPSPGWWCGKPTEQGPGQGPGSGHDKDTPCTSPLPQQSYTVLLTWLNLNSGVEAPRPQPQLLSLPCLSLQSVLWPHLPNKHSPQAYWNILFRIQTCWNAPHTEIQTLRPHASLLFLCSLDRKLP